MPTNLAEDRPACHGSNFALYARRPGFKQPGVSGSGLAYSGSQPKPGAVRDFAIRSVQ